MAGQDLDQFEVGVLSSLMGAATRVFFQLTGTDSKRIASDLADAMIETKTFPRQRLRIGAVKNGNELSLVSRGYTFTSPSWITSELIRARKKEVAEAMRPLYSPQAELRRHEAVAATYDEYMKAHPLAAKGEWGVLLEQLWEFLRTSTLKSRKWPDDPRPRLTRSRWRRFPKMSGCWRGTCSGWRVTWRP